MKALETLSPNIFFSDLVLVEFYMFLAFFILSFHENIKKYLLTINNIMY